MSKEQATEAGTCHLGPKRNVWANKSWVAQAPRTKPPNTGMPGETVGQATREAGSPNLYSDSPGPWHVSEFPDNKTDQKVQIGRAHV